MSWTQSSLNQPKKITHSKAIILAQAYMTTGQPGKSEAGQPLGIVWASIEMYKEKSIVKKSSLLQTG
ncbi:hypothetical protein HO639_10505 [Streptococcus suis]|uniref:hypothetical protein n=1 Tax=Streptococcus suis TaxID=1307 RepID=UPI0005CE0FBC|nr:hypothetical protein [Streptococcus suis]NQH69315.1 hypothetical protein [Streptococcus suis]